MEDEIALSNEQIPETVRLWNEAVWTCASRIEQMGKNDIDFKVFADQAVEEIKGLLI